MPTIIIGRPSGKSPSVQTANPQRHNPIILDDNTLFSLQLPKTVTVIACYSIYGQYPTWEIQ